MVEHVDALPRSEDADNLSDDFPTNTMPYVTAHPQAPAKPLNSCRIFCWTC